MPLFLLSPLSKHLDFMGNWNRKSHRRASSLDFHWIPLEFIKVHSTPTHPSTATACKSAAVLSPKWPGTQRMSQPIPPKTNVLPLLSPLKGHHSVAIKRGALRKTYRMIGFQWFFLLTKWWGRVHQPPLFITPPFCTEVYLARMFDFCFSLVWILLACFDHVPQKRHHFVRTNFSTIIYRLIWAWNTFYPKPLLLRIPWKHVLQDGRLQLRSGKLTAFCICGFPHLDTSMYWYTPIFLGRLWIYSNILHCSKPCSPNIILQNGGVLAHFLKHGLDNV